MADVGGIIAQTHAKRLDCPICMCACEPLIIDRRTRASNHFEHLRCETTDQTFRRVWIDGYAR